MRQPAVRGRHAISPRWRAAGVTLIELMMAIVVLGILVGIAVPSFRNASIGAKLGSVANNLLASVQLARSEAIKRNEAVTLCASANGTSCAASGGWEQGWIILDNAANVIQRQAAAGTGLKVTQGGGTNAINFQPIGIGATAATFTVCSNAPVGAQERVLTINASGSAAVTITYAGTCT